MSAVLEHQITVADLLMVGAVGIVLAACVVAYAIIAVNMGRDR